MLVKSECANGPSPSRTIAVSTDSPTVLPLPI
ncbi:Uncharacterised protein [Mycobacteroides abscessus subsp. abscessus]|nr:Uncharacterised protein [Mycobacteroides abscessus subsp. abscessus]